MGRRKRKQQTQKFVSDYQTFVHISSDDEFLFDKEAKETESDSLAINDYIQNVKESHGENLENILSHLDINPEVTYGDEAIKEDQEVEYESNYIYAISSEEEDDEEDSEEDGEKDIDEIDIDDDFEDDFDDDFDFDDEKATKASHKKKVDKSSDLISEFRKNLLNGRTSNKKKSTIPKHIKRQQKSQKLLESTKYGDLELQSVNEKILGFLATGKPGDCLHLEPQPKKERSIVHKLAACYGLKSASQGKGRSRFTSLTMKGNSGIPENKSKINDILLKAYKKSKSGAGASGAGAGGSAKGALENSGTKVPYGCRIGEKAKALDETNLGNRLLQKMGWKPGEGLGKGTSSATSIKQPIEAIVRESRLGLGG